MSSVDADRSVAAMAMKVDDIYREREDRAIKAIEDSGFFQHMYTYTPDGEDRRVVFTPAAICHGLLELEAMAFRVTNE